MLIEKFFARELTLVQCLAALDSALDSALEFTDAKNLVACRGEFVSMGVLDDWGQNISS